MVIFLLSLTLNGIVWFVCYKYHFLMDIPNERSSHVTPTPRCGGIAIVLSFIGTLLYYGYTGPLAGIIILSVVSLWDDFKNIHPLPRLMCHFIAVVIGYIQIFGWEYHIFTIPLVIFCVWIINLYNFMDGINGIAACEGIFVFGSLYALNNCQTTIYLPLVLCLLGYLPWNFPKSKMIMGDIGSCNIGYIFSYILMTFAREQSHLFWVGCVLLGLFLCDSTITLLHRLIRKQAFWKAHREHSYQVLTRQLKNHTQVTSLVSIINMVVVLPLSYWLYDDFSMIRAALSLLIISILCIIPKLLYKSQIYQ
jgi:Fuc2NAc and GlcNAc transferase